MTKISFDACPRFPYDALDEPRRKEITKGDRSFFVQLVPCQVANHLQVCELLADSFQGKFGSLVRLNKQRTARLIADSWSDQPSSCAQQFGIFIEDSNQLAGTIALKGKSAYSVNENSQDQTDWLRMILDYGLLNVLKFAAGMTVLAYKPRADECYIEHLAVASEYRGYGMGKMLLNQAVHAAQQAGFEYITLHVSEHSQSAIRLYKQAGFELVDRQRRLLGDFFFGKQAWLFMSRPLNVYQI